MPITSPSRYQSLRLCMMLALAALPWQNPAWSAAISLVNDSKAIATIITADRPNPVAQYAAEELALHIEKATGVRLPIMFESKVEATVVQRVYVGDCKAMRAAGIDPSKLTAEAFTLRTAGQSLFIAGDDKHDDPLDPDTRAGTLWGVYEWLDRTLHVRWLWPGELGTFVPKATTVLASDVDETKAPPFFQRKIRPGLGFTSQHPELGFSPAAFEKFSHEQTVFLRRHGMGRSLSMSNSHAFVDWWKTYGKEHPEWFQLREGGKRGPHKPSSRFSMCVSNPEFQNQILSLWKTKRSTKPGALNFINACENDILGQCTCDNCRAWDGPVPDDFLKHYSATSKMVNSRFVSDRYAHFWLSLQQQAARIDPKATVVGYVYFNYFQAPTTGVKLNEHILLGYCPSGGWFPRSADEHAWMKQQWDGWHSTGARLFLRSNHLLDGYCMPYLFAHQFADDFQHAARNGMVATDLDSLTGQWATQGPNLYLATRLHKHPNALADEVLAEYYGAFGAAATAVQAYFDYWESYTMQHREQTNKTMEDLQASRWRSWAKAAHLVYPPVCFVPAESLLADAKKAAMGDAASTARVAFLELGLTHAKICARVSGLLSRASPVASPAQTQAALAELITFRRAHENSGIGNFNHLAWVEDSSWKF